MQGTRETAAVYLNLLAAAYPGWRSLGLECIVRQEFEAERNWNPSLFPTLEAAGVWDDVIRRLQQVHPVAVEREHHLEHDKQIFAVLVEAQAAAWAFESGLGRPEFVRHEGAPDWKVDEGWVEAKQLQPSEGDRAADAAAQARAPNKDIIVRIEPGKAEVPPGLIRQFRSLFDDAANKKWKRQGCSGNLTLYAQIHPDLGTPDAAAIQLLRDCAIELVGSTPRTRIVLDLQPGPFLVIPEL